MLKKIASIFSNLQVSDSTFVDLSYKEAIATDNSVFDMLQRGNILIIRGMKPIFDGRKKFIEYATGIGGQQTLEELTDFYATGKTPSLDTIFAVSETVKHFRKNHIWSRFLHHFLYSINPTGPVLYDGGIPRLVLETDFVAKAAQSGYFEATDFQRTDPAGTTEIFMPRATNIHRDYNRAHYLFQFNVWWPLHDASRKEVLRIFHSEYKKKSFDRDCDEKELEALGAPFDYKLNFGDAVVFHGEHMHASPAGIPGLRRQSVDFRVAACCDDDNAHYRRGFLNSKNFEGSENQKRGVDWVIEIQDTTTKKDASWFKGALNAFQDLPFSEDSYILLHDQAKQRNPKVAKDAIKAVLSQSTSFFWLLKAGERARAIGANEMAKDAANKIIEMTKNYTLPNYMPVKYPNPAQQITPEYAQAWSKKVMSLA
tara:strand:- start:1626 stop:2903 length:1278 start_codon:yes stop_codon:yes gene_type:complete